ncbi:MAG: carbohydrate kinase, partial [Thermomicrobiales bacterium]|nr:carbohydrate kinase [Thermomicrobiales bacterium]
AVITRGLEPLLVLHDGRVDEVPAFPVEVVYDIGAGDAFHAAFLAIWRPGADPVACARFAAAAAALKIGRGADQLPMRADVLEFLAARADE